MDIEYFTFKNVTTRNTGLAADQQMEPKQLFLSEEH